jgi:hypothetical protein
MRYWDLAVDRDDLSRTSLTDVAAPVIGDGEAVLRVDRVGLTANNVTYAVLGDSFRYWEFFPARAGQGHVPLWGFAEVVESAVAGVTVGDRVYGYLPPASHLVVRPGRVDARGFNDATEHRTALPSPYNAYALTTADPAYAADQEDLHVLYRPLFYTSFMLADQVEDREFYGARVVVLSSASSKTAYGTAFLLRGRGADVVGLTSAANVAFTESLGCYDRVLPYDAVTDLDPDVPTVYLDVAGSADVRRRIRAHLGEQLVHDGVVGVSHQEVAGAEALGGPRTVVFFAPDQMRKRTSDWGRDGLDQRFAEAWQRFAPAVTDWVDVVVSHGPEALRDVWLEVLAGRSSPREGNVIQL